MRRKISTLFALFFGLATALIAQDKSKTVMTTSLGNYPKNAWEVGVHGGHFFVAGDVQMRPGWGAGLHVRRGVDYPISVRLDASYNTGYGIEPRASSNLAGLVQSDFASNATIANLGRLYATTPFYHAYKTTFTQVSVQGLLSLNNWNYKKQLKKFNVYGLAGIGLDWFTTKLNALNGTAAYSFPATVSGQGDIKDKLDDSYETEMPRPASHTNADGVKTNFHVQGGAGISFRVTPRFNIGIEHTATMLFGINADMLDGWRWRTATDQTPNRDVLNYTSIRLNFNISPKGEKTEPLYWVSPMDIMQEDIAELKARPKFDPTDTDGDGVIDMFDQEKETPAGAAVDTRGVQLDSDKDGVPDYKDKEPYSPPGYKVSNEGVAQVPKPNFVTEPDVIRIVDGKLADMKAAMEKNAGFSEWFLPMIHFEFDKYYIKRSEYQNLQHVASVLQMNPKIKVLVTGYTDGPASNKYNTMLSYNRANETIDALVKKFNVSRDRLILNYFGEDKQLIPTPAKQYYNRRVEFKVAKTETEMAKPEGPKAGSKKYSGNKDAGY